MRNREVVTQWNTMQEGDTFLRYTKEGAVTMLVVQREAPDLPMKKGTMGYAKIERDGGFYNEVFLVRIYGEDTDHPFPWVAPFGTGTHHAMADSHIVEFREVDVVPTIDRRTMEDAIIEGSARAKADLDFVGVNVGGIYNAIANLLYPSE